MGEDNFITKIKNKKVPIIVAVMIWLFGVIFLISPIAYCLQISSINGSFNAEIF